MLDFVDRLPGLRVFDTVYLNSNQVGELPTKSDVRPNKFSMFSFFDALALSLGPQFRSVPPESAQGLYSRNIDFFSAVQWSASQSVLSIVIDKSNGLSRISWIRARR